MATVFRILNAAQAVSGNPHADARVVGSDGQDYLPTGNTVVECSGDLTGHFQLAPGASATECSAFEVPRSVRAEKVDYLPSAGTANDYGEWLVP